MARVSPPDERPETSFEEVEQWAGLSFVELAERGVSVPDNTTTDGIAQGVLLPVDRPPRAMRLTLIDWDDVRDPETGEIHPAAAHYIEKYGGYVEISQSGKGLHQLVLGGFTGERKKLLSTIDDRVFVGDPDDDDDLPMVEVYDGGRLVAMTGRHVEGTARDLTDGQDAIDSLVAQYAQNELEDGYRATLPSAGAAEYNSGHGAASGSGSDIDSEVGVGADADVNVSTDPDAREHLMIPSHDEYAGPTFERLRETCPEDRPLGYHAVVLAFVEGFDHGYANVRNWKLEGAAAANGYAAELTPDEIVSDPRGDYLDLGDDVHSAGFDRKTRGRVEADYKKASRGDFSPHSWTRFASWGIMPPEAATYSDGERPTADRYPSAKTPTPGGHAIEECEPPKNDAEVLDVDARREALKGERFDAYLADDVPHLWRDPQGAGKTTTATLAAANRGLPYAPFVERHKKARGHACDDVTPDDYYHLKGSNQKRYETCMDADHADEECPIHGNTGCPHMCPVYDLAPDHPVRAEYEHLVAEVGPEKTHELMADRLAKYGHDENGMGPWRHGFKEAAKAENVVAVHEHQTLRSATHKEGGTSRVPIVDEHPNLGDMYGQNLGVEQLLAAAHTLETPSNGDVAGARNEFARFADRLVTALTTPSPNADVDAGEDAGAGAGADSETPTDTDTNANLLTDVEPPNVVEYAETETVVVDDFGLEITDDDLPGGVTTADVFETTDTEREYQNPAEPQEGYREREVTRHVFERPAIREVLAEVKLTYNRRVLARMRDGDWNGEPFAFDTLLAAAAEAGLDADAARQAMALPDDLGDQTCPRCGGHLIQRNGAGVCMTDSGCGWDEATDPILAADAPQARAIASLIRRDDPTGDGAEGAKLSSTILPHPDELPSNPLVLDATGNPVVIGATYGVDPEDVVVSGDTTPEMPNFHITQVLDGQYHWSTLNNDESTAFDRMMDAVEQIAPLHEQVLAVGPKALAAKVNDERGGFPENVDFAHYHAVKGENAYKDHDAMFTLGAPPVRVDGPGGIREQARLLAQGDHADGIEVGGVEHSTRRGTEDPIRRKLRFEDDDGKGKEVPTKGYTGLVGTLYAIHHEREIEQAVHRIRPVNATSDTPKHAYLFTNVPTDLPVDEVVTLDELSASPAALLPVCDNALALAEALADAAIDGDNGVRDGFRAQSFVTRGRDGSLTFHKKQIHRFAQTEVEAISDDVSLQAVNKWVNELTDLGLLDAGEYEQRRGVPYTTEIATLNEALSVLTSNASFKVAQKRRLAALVANLDSAAEWLRTARGLFDLHGDRCGLGGGRPGGDGGCEHDPPPT